MKLCVAFAFVFLFFSCYSQEKTGNTEYVFTSVNVIPMNSETVLANQDVVVRNGRIFSIGPNKKMKYGKNAVVIDAKGKFLMPGLAEMHAHVPPVDDIEPMKDVLLLFAAHGITTIRGMLGHPRHIELRDKLNKGEITGPRFITSGPSFSGGSVKSPAEAEAKVREQKKAGYDFLKIHPGLSPENYDAMAKTADREGIRFAGHVPFRVGVWHAIEAKQETIDHLDAFVEGLIPDRENLKEEEAGLFAIFAGDRADTGRIPQLMQALKSNNVWVVPTQALAERWMTPARTAESFRNDPEMKYMREETLNDWVRAKNSLTSDPRYKADAVARFIGLRKKLIYECNRNGVGLLLGCDAPQIFNVPGISTHHELQYLVDAGLTPYEALKTGTVNVGRFYKSPEIGVITKGAHAELILLAGNPLEDISNTKKIEGVMLRDTWFDRKALDATLRKLEKSGSVAQN